MTAVHSFELLEAITDTDVALATTFAPPLAWYSNVSGSTGEICSVPACSGVRGIAAGYRVNKGWSNSQNACVVDNPNLTTTTTTSTTTTSTAAGGSTTTTTSTAPGPTTTTTTASNTTTTTIGGGNPPFGGDDTGLLPPPGSALLKCENGVAKATGKLMAALVKCHIARASGKTTDDAGEDACETIAIAKFTLKTKTAGCGSCTDLSAIARAIEGIVDSNNGLAYCQ